MSNLKDKINEFLAPYSLEFQDEKFKDKLYVFILDEKDKSFIAGQWAGVNWANDRKYE